METTVRQAAAKMIRASFAIATIAAALVMVGPPANAQDYLVNGRPASAGETQYLITQGMPAGNWQIDGWGISPAAGAGPAAVSDAVAGKCWYVLDVPLGDCSVAIAKDEPTGSDHVRLAAAEPRHAAQVRHAGTDAE
jgi:hypothetical protein